MHLGVILQLAVLSDLHIRPDVGASPDYTAGPDHGPLADLRQVPHNSTFADDSLRRDISTVVLGSQRLLHPWTSVARAETPRSAGPCGNVRPGHEVGPTRTA